MLELGPSAGVKGEEAERGASDRGNTARARTRR